LSSGRECDLLAAAIGLRSPQLFAPRSRRPNSPPDRLQRVSRDHCFLVGRDHALVDYTACGVPRAVGRYLSGLLKGGRVRGVLAAAIADAKREARASCLTDEDIDAELEAWRAEC